MTEWRNRIALRLLSRLSYERITKAGGPMYWICRFAADTPQFRAALVDLIRNKMVVEQQKLNALLRWKLGRARVSLSRIGWRGTPENTGEYFS